MIYFYSSLRVYGDSTCVYFCVFELIGRPFCEFILFKERRGQATSGVAGRVYSKKQQLKTEFFECLC